MASQRRKGHTHSLYDYDTGTFCTENHSLSNRVAKQFKRLHKRVLKLRRQWREARREVAFRRIENRTSKFAPPQFRSDPIAKTTGERVVEFLGPEAAENLTDTQLQRIAEGANNFRQETEMPPAILSINTDTDDHS